jgi:hemolysin activation/secretion protein
MRHLAILIAAMSATGMAYAQTPPNAGSVLRDEAPARSQPPKESATLPRLSEPVLESADRQPISVRAIQVSGATQFPADELVALVADMTEGSHTLGELQKAAARITLHYRKAGYFQTRAYLPKQQIKDGVVTIVVLEGKLEKVQFDNKSRLSDATVERYFTDLTPGSILQKEPTDRSILVLSDVPGAGQVDSRLAPGTNTGESVLVANIGGTPLLSGRLEADNHGGLYTGRDRLSVSADLNSPFGYGERFSARVMGSNDDLLYGRLAGQMPVGGDGWTVGAAVGHTTYELGNTFAALDAVGRSTTGEVFARYPLVRSTSANVYVQPGFEYRKLHDEIRSTSTTTDKHANVAMLNLSADARDGWLGGGAMQGSVAFSGGRLSFDSSDAEAIDAMGARTAGSYNKVLANVERQQYVVANLTLVGQLRGQWSDSNLDSSEKFTLGGPNGVRAYATSEAAGDRGWLATLELRYGVAPLLTLAAFYDAGKAWVNTDPYLATPNVLHRRGSGVGISGGYADFDWRAYAAWREDEVGTAEPDKRPRYWLQAGWRF